MNKRCSPYIILKLFHRNGPKLTVSDNLIYLTEGQKKIANDTISGKFEVFEIIGLLAPGGWKLSSQRCQKKKQKPLRLVSA